MNKGFQGYQVGNVDNLHAIYVVLEGNAFLMTHKALAHAVGLNEATIFSELLSRRKYFLSRGILGRDGYFFNTINDLQAATSLTAYQQRVATANLRKVGLIDCKVKGVPPKRYFLINNDPNLLIEILRDGEHKMECLKEGIPFSSATLVEKEPDLVPLNVSPENAEFLDLRVRMARSIEA